MNKVKPIFVEESMCVPGNSNVAVMRTALNRYRLWMASLGCFILTGCLGVFPPGTFAGMAGPDDKSDKAIDYPERFVYRIDDHRYITLQGTRNCVGTISYYDTRLGIHTRVADSGRSLGNGVFRGYYAVDSSYVVIPVIRFSNYSGSLLYIYYSRDGGKTFKRFLAGGYAGDRAIIVLTDKSLYVAWGDTVPLGDLYLADLYDVSQDIVIGDSQQAIKPQGQWIDPTRVPLTVKSPSGSTQWKCGDPIDVK